MVHQLTRGQPLRPRGTLRQVDTRRHHRALVLQQLFGDGPASRADLARSTGLTKVTVSDLIAGLITEGRVEELGTPDSPRVGKPPTLVGLAADSAHLVAIDLSGDDCVTGAVINLSGEVRARHRVARDGATGAAAEQLVLRFASELIGMTSAEVLGIGVGSPGVVTADGTVIDAPNLGWHGVPLAARFQERIGIPTFVANDANTAVLGEHTFGDNDDADLMVIRIGTGVGSGLVLAGQLLHGYGFAAGEIGHITVDPTGEACACSRRGCLETVLAVPRLRRALAQEQTEAVLARAGHHLGCVLAPIIGALNLRHVVLSGPDELLGGHLIETTADTIRARTMPVSSDGLVVRSSILGQDVVLMGAAVLVLAGELGVS